MGRASDVENQPTSRGSSGGVENGPAAALFVSQVSIQTCSLVPCRRSVLKATTSPVYARRRTSFISSKNSFQTRVWAVHPTHWRDCCFYHALAGVPVGGQYQQFVGIHS